jgi:hypothetical protein
MKTIERPICPVHNTKMQGSPAGPYCCECENEEVKKLVEVPPSVVKLPTTGRTFSWALAEIDERRRGVPHDS